MKFLCGYPQGHRSGAMPNLIWAFSVLVWHEGPFSNCTSFTCHTQSKGGRNVHLRVPSLCGDTNNLIKRIFYGVFLWFITGIYQLQLNLC